MPMVWKGDANRRLAKSLVTLIDDVTQKFPGRATDNDGTIGDAAHQAKGPASDHNPHVHLGAMRIVTALDITHDPAHGFDAQAFADSLREGKDPRIKYVIFNGRIFSSTNTPWTWRARGQGPGDHSHHVHISVVDDAALYDDTKPWVYSMAGAVAGHTEPAPPKLKLGSTGPAVIDLQNLLKIPPTGVFDLRTDAEVRQFQASRNLFVDGIVGTHTWGALKSTAAKPSGGKVGALTPTAIDRIVKLAAASDIAKYNWPNRGVAPRGYIKGMAVVFGHVYAKLKAGDSAAQVMATMSSGNGDTDALAWYEPQFQAAGMSNSTTGVATLRHLFALMIGLGMRESSGQYSVGRDMSASNTDADTAEAGLFQMSWNAHTASSEIPKLFAAYSAAGADGFLSIFQEGVTPKPSDLENFGTGEGFAFQQLCKTCPAFAVEAAAVGLRVRRKHWGPINNHAAEIRAEADRLLAEVQGVVDMPDAVAQAPAPAEERETHSLLKRILERLSKDGGGTTMPAPAENNPIALLEQVAKLLQSLQPQNKPDQPAPGDQQVDTLRKVIALLMPIINPDAAAAKDAPLGQVNGALGQTIGKLLNGKKTAIGTIGALLTSLLSATSGTDTGIASVLKMLIPAAGLSQFAMPVFLALAAWGVLGKLEKWLPGKLGANQLPKQ